MTVERFIEEYNKAENKEEFLSERVKEKYIPYEEKIARCEKIAKHTMYTSVDGVINNVYKINTPIRYVLHSLTLINLYTDIDIEDDKLLQAFNVFEENQLISEIIDVLPENEVKRFSQVLDWVITDKIENERSLTSYLDTKKEAIEMAFGAMLSAASELMSADNNVEIDE